MISMEMIKSFSYLHRTLIACLFLRVTHTKIRRMRKMAVRMEDSGSYLKIMMITMIVALVMAMAMKMVMVMMVGIEDEGETVVIKFSGFRICQITCVGISDQD